MTVIPETCHAC